MIKSLLNRINWKKAKKAIIFILLAGIIYQGCTILLATPRRGSHSAYFHYESFVLVEVELNSATASKNITENSTIGSSGSGMAIGTTRAGHTAILTAFHVCQPSIITAASILLGEDAVKITKVTDFFGNESRARIIMGNSEDDLCILEVPEISVPGVRISPRPAMMGDLVYTVAAPQAFFMPGMVPLLNGFYSGNVRTTQGEDSVYTIPTTQGSSGAAVFNNSGRIVGVIHSALRGYSNVAICATHDELTNFINEFKNSLGGRIVQ